ncbi:MAG: cupin domain-containing protein [Halioglobus sp.]|nr:cupin domain-containing protein [Halioglobus sp.]
MSDTTTTRYDQVLDEETLLLLGDAALMPSAEARPTGALRKRVMERLDQYVADTSQDFCTVRSEQGRWIQVGPKICKKLLFHQAHTGAESFLLRAEPGAQIPSHFHEHDEHCIVLEGELVFENGVHLKAGDYHFAPAGTEHGIGRCPGPALVYVQTGPGVFHPEP